MSPTAPSATTPPNGILKSSKPPTLSPPSSTTSRQKATKPSATTTSIPNYRDHGTHRTALAGDQRMDTRRRTESRLVQPPSESIRT